MDVDLETVRLAMAGERTAYGELVASCWIPLVRLARGVVGDADAEDAVQDALVTAGEKLGQLRRPEAFSAWVRRLVVRVCLRRRKRRAFFSWSSIDDDGAPSELRSGDDPADLDAGIDVERMLAVLPPRQRTVLYLTTVEGRSDGEIAELLDISSGTVRSLRRHARSRLQEHFAPLFPPRASQEGASR